MAKSKSALERLHPLLKKRPSRREDRGSDEARYSAMWAALIDTYGVKDKWIATSRAPADMSLSSAFWEALATKLVIDWIPSYRPSEAGRPARFGEPHPEDWYAAGGGLITWPNDMTSFYQAQLVQLVSRLEAEKNQSKEWVFQWLANEQAVVGPHQAAERRKMLPRPYRQRKTSASIREAYGRVPDHVRANPAAHLPGYQASSLVLPPLSALKAAGIV